MSTSQRVTISKNTIEKLEPFAKKFESIDECINRLVSDKCCDEHSEDILMEDHHA